ncbi:MAG: hypothetical protein ACF8SC_02635 [Phycisphaerales bacterium JB037]
MTQGRAPGGATGTRSWKAGDRLVHVRRPEWGEGTVVTAKPAVHEGSSCQQLSIRFEHERGLKNILTAIADLRLLAGGGNGHRPADGPRPASTVRTEPLGRSHAPSPDAEAGWLDALERERAGSDLSGLPEDCTDPLLPERTRFERTLALYRFNPEGGSLIEWATAQTGLRDPLTRYNRHELEEQFSRFRRRLDDHARTLADAMRRTPGSGFEALLARAPEAARRALSPRHARR